VDINPVASRRLPVPEAKLVSAETEVVATLSVEAVVSEGVAQPSVEVGAIVEVEWLDEAAAEIAAAVVEVDEASYELLRTYSTKIGSHFGPGHPGD
jgi:hypothetical protein